jgi:hypothetical protein
MQAEEIAGSIATDMAYLSRLRYRKMQPCLVEVSWTVQSLEAPVVSALGVPDDKVKIFRDPNPLTGWWGRAVRLQASQRALLCTEFR